MEKETKPSSSFMADFLTRAQAVCGGSADAPQLCEADGAGSGGCAGPRRRVNVGDTRAKGPRRRRALGRGKAGHRDARRVAVDMPCVLPHPHGPPRGGRDPCGASAPRAPAAGSLPSA